MRFEKRKIFKTITSDSPEAFDNLCNEYLATAQNCEMHFNNIDGKYSVTIIGTVTKEIPESISEKYEILGQCHKCGECKYYRKSHDRRVKYVKCDKNILVNENQCCCDVFYKELEGGE